MRTVYSVGLYCPYEGGYPSMFFNKEEDAQFMVRFLQRYSVAMDEKLETEDYEQCRPLHELEKEFKEYFNTSTPFTFPWKFIKSLSKFEVIKHTIMDLDPLSVNILNRLDDLGY